MELRSLVSQSRCTTISAQVLVLLDLHPVLHQNLIDLCSRHRLFPNWTECSQHHPLAFNALGLAASRSSSGFACGLLRSSAAWTLRASLSSCCISVIIFPARCAVRLRLATRQDRVASSTWIRSVLLGFHTCTDVDFAWTQNSALSSTHRWSHWQWFLAIACCNCDTLLMSLHHHLAVLLASSSMMHPQLRSTRPRQNVLTVFRLIAGFLTTRRSADVHLIGSQPQSEIHSIEELRFQHVRSASCSVQTKVEDAPTNNWYLFPVRFETRSLVRCPLRRFQFQTLRPSLLHA